MRRPFLRLGALAARSAGSSAREARLAGADLDQQLLAGAGAAAITYGTERLSNLSKPFQKIYGKGAAETIAGRLAGKFGESTAMQMLTRFSSSAGGRIFLSGLGEAAEENVEGFLQAAWDRFVYDPDAKYTLEEAKQDALVAGILGALGGVPEGISQISSRRGGNRTETGAGAEIQAPAGLVPRAETGVRAETQTPEVMDAFLEGFLDGDTEPVRTRRGAAAKGSYPGETLALPQGGVVTGLADSGGGRLALEEGGGLPGVVDFGELYAAALQNGFVQPGAIQDWRAELGVPALRLEGLQDLYGAQPAVPLLPEWSGGGREGLVEIEGVALVPMFQDAVETGLEAENRREFAEFQAVLGDDAPKSLAEFLDLKYNQPDKWDYTKRFAGYMKKYPNSGKRYFDVQETLRIHGIDKGIALPPIQKKAFILPDGKYDPYHIMHRMMARQITDDQIRGYIKDAKIMFVQWNGQRQRFVGVNGTCVITKSKDGWIFKTAWKKSDNDEEADKIMEAIKNAGL